MAYQLLLNIIVGLVWMLLNNEWSFLQFVIGYLIGLLLIGLLQRFLPHSFYGKKLLSIAKLLYIFNRELFLSSFTVIRQVLRPKLDIRPGIFAYPTRLTSDWEVTLLSCLICLTPGTLTLEVSREGSTLYIHAMDIGDVNELTVQIRDTFEKAIMEVTRS